MWTDGQSRACLPGNPDGSSPAQRILGAVAWIFFIALLPNHHWRWQVPTALALLFLTIRWRLPWRELFWRACMLGPFIGLTALGLLGQPDWPLRTANLLIKAALSLWVISLLARTMAFTDFLLGLRQLRFPAIGVELIAFLFRYFAVLSDEWRRMQLARRARTFRPQRGHEFFLLTQALGCLFLRAYERAERVHQAMLARGYQSR
jgi:cobalt/nickel transport system permease protein